MHWAWTTGIFGMAVCCGALGAGAVEPPTFAFPVSCELGQTCFVQSYPDVDPTKGVRDHSCGSSTYDGHKGTDIRLLSTAKAKKGVGVVAAAAGKVKALRDGVADRLIGKNLSAVKGKECGNGVVIDHGRGWESQYCHMLKGSIQVVKGQNVAAGERLGFVGYSGQTQFAHLHFAVRHNAKTIDPFTGRKLSEGACGPKAKNSLWKPDVGAALSSRKGELIDLGFVEKPVQSKVLEVGNPPVSIVSRKSPALIFYARFINMQPGDSLKLSIWGPEGPIASGAQKPVDRAKAHYLAYTGRKRRGAVWAAGAYHGSVQLIRSGKAILRGKATIQLR